MDIHTLINLFHILFVAPLFLWVGSQRDAVPQHFYWILFGLGMVVLVYHAYKTNARFQSGSPLVWINLIHFLLIGPLLIYIGWYQKDTPRGAYELLLLSGFGALGYHLYEIIKYNV